MLLNKNEIIDNDGMIDFTSFGLPKILLDSLVRLNFKTPTPIQKETIPIAMCGHDILGSAQTGTGKTAAFGIPIIAKLLDKPNSSALVITPTRELAYQVMKSLELMLGRRSFVKTVLLVGGENIEKQLSKLRQKPQLFVGTPGRINDHLIRRSLDLSKVDFFVLDETDRMLDMGFAEQIEKIIQHLPLQRQTLLFSATIPNEIVKLANSYMKSPKRIAIGHSFDTAINIKQDVLRVKQEDKVTELFREVSERDGSIIVFVKTKFGVEKIGKLLKDKLYNTDIIHGDLKHNQRRRVIKDFIDQKYRILVATDVAARGLDIPHIRHVINYDLPQCPADYVHRIGRTARAGSDGSSICFITPSDVRMWNSISRLIDPHMRDSIQQDIKTDNKFVKKNKNSHYSSKFSFFKNKNSSNSRRSRNVTSAK